MGYIMFDVLHKQKWHKVTEVEKCDDAVTYQVEGIHGKVHSADVDDVRLAKDWQMKKPNGSVERGPGKEPLKKEPMKKSLTQRWELLKAKLNHETAIQSLSDDGEDDEAADPSAGAADGGDAEVPQQQAQPQDEQQGSGDPEQDAGGDDNAEAPVEGGEEQPEDGEQEGGGEQDEAELVQHLKEQGYSDPEIAHIVHGHVPQQLTPEEMESQGHSQALEHKDMSHQQKLEAEGKQHEIKGTHAERMADLEAEYAKKEKEIRLKYLEQELQAKVANLKNKDKK